MDALPQALYRAAQVRELDRLAIEDYGIAGTALMERAGAAVFAAMRSRWPQAERVAVLCGTGNNGGDGFVVARLAHEAGMAVDVWLVGESGRLRDSALESCEHLRHSGLRPMPYDGQGLQNCDLVVDALLGTGLDREVSGSWRAAITAINASGCAVISIDIPSGLHADSGAMLGLAVRAWLTVSFIGLKQGLLTAWGPDCCGQVVFDDLAVPAEVFTHLSPAAVRISDTAMAGLLLPRQRNAHKGCYGHLLVVGGDRGMPGAARLAGEAAARCGAGLVSIATRPEHAPVLSGARPELMAHGVWGRRGLNELLPTATVVAVGPGLGKRCWARELLSVLLAEDRLMVVDADALNLLAEAPQRRARWILTPHPGEAARLLGVSTTEIQTDRFQAVVAIQRRYGGVCVLKGVGSLIADGVQPVAVCSAGNPGMASGGMGDVLTGVIAGLLAQGLSPQDAARLGVCLHAAAGDRAAAAGERGLLAGDLMPWLQRLVNPEKVAAGTDLE